MNKVKEISQKSVASPSDIAMVIESNNGEASKLSERHNREIPLRGHLSHVPWLEAGDEVLIVDTPEGAIISGRIRRAGELPQATLSVQANAIALMGDRALRLQVGESQFELLPDGQVRIQGKVISQVAADSLHLFGPVVEVN
jgi:hypothetical protein